MDILPAANTPPLRPTKELAYFGNCELIAWGRDRRPTAQRKARAQYIRASLCRSATAIFKKIFLQGFKAAIQNCLKVGKP
jgi:hypothetical protein